MSSAAPILNSAIYTGVVRHRRYTPKVNNFTYKVFMVYLDLRELDKVFSLSSWWSKESFNLACYRRKDFFDGKDDRSLYDAVADLVENRNGIRPTGPIRMLTNLRYFGFIINPITCYYCFDEKGENVETVVAEVTNTPWGNRIHYILNVDSGSRSKQLFNFKKEMHVSPFQPMDLDYKWVGTTPSKDLLVHIDVAKEKNVVLDATLTLKRSHMSSGVMNKMIWLYPLMTVKVLTAIYWQAIKLVFKRIPFFSNPEGDMKTNKQG